MDIVIFYIFLFSKKKKFSQKKIVFVTINRNSRETKHHVINISEDEEIARFYCVSTELEVGILSGNVEVVMNERENAEEDSSEMASAESGENLVSSDGVSKTSYNLENDLDLSSSDENDASEGDNSKMDDQEKSDSSVDEDYSMMNDLEKERIHKEIEDEHEMIRKLDLMAIEKEKFESSLPLERNGKY